LGRVGLPDFCPVGSTPLLYHIKLQGSGSRPTVRGAAGRADGVGSGRRPEKAKPPLRLAMWIRASSDRTSSEISAAAHRAGAPYPRGRASQRSEDGEVHQALPKWALLNSSRAAFTRRCKFRRGRTGGCAERFGPGRQPRLQGWLVFPTPAGGRRCGATLLCFLCCLVCLAA